MAGTEILIIRRFGEVDETNQNSFRIDGGGGDGGVVRRGELRGD